MRWENRKQIHERFLKSTRNGSREFIYGFIYNKNQQSSNPHLRISQWKPKSVIGEFEFKTENIIKVQTNDNF